MRQSTKRLISMALSLFLVVGAFVIYFNFTQPAYQDFIGVRAEQLSREQFIENQGSAITQMKKLIDAFHAQGTVQERVSLSLPTDPDVGGAVVQLHGLTEVSHVSGRSFSVAVIKPPQREVSTSSIAVSVKPYGTVTLTTQLSGTYDDFKNFLHYLETNIRLLDLQNVTVSPKFDKSNNVVGFTFNVTVATYYQTK